MMQIQEHLLEEVQRQARKINRDKNLREKSKENMHVIRNLIQKEKQSEYNRVKVKTKENEMRITQSLRQSIYLKRQRSLEIKIQQENSRLNKTIFMEKKRLLTKSNSEVELQPLKLGSARASQYIKHMKQLEKQMVEQLNSSRSRLSNSKISRRNVLR